MNTGNTFHLTQAAAEKYQAHSVPAMFEPLARATMDKIRLPENVHILDVACGTGALTREIARNLPGKGQITGTDLNETMIDVARQQQPDTPHQMNWLAGDVSDLPFGDETFDIAFIQQGLQFFPDKPAALSEIARVVKPGGRLYLTCWRAISPFNNSIAKAMVEYISEAAAEKARAPFSFCDGDLIGSLLRGAGFSITNHDAIILEREFVDLRAQIMALPVEKDMREKGDDVVELVIARVAELLAPFDRNGVFIVPQEAHFFSAKRS
jgi:SAM-dependent methyltransferase